MLPSNENLEKRTVFFVASILLVAILLFRFFTLQIMSGEIYQQKSFENSVKIETRFPVRGNIYDRNGILIADNRPAFSLYLIRARTKPQTIETVSNTLNLNESDLQKKMRTAGYFQPLKIIRQVDQFTLTNLQENVLDLPGLDWKVEPKRNYYSYNKCFSHVLGTLGEIADEELDNNPEYEQGDIVGKKGIEKALDQQLRGKKGFQYVKVDAYGREVEFVGSSQSFLPYPGQDLYMTIDARLQSFADSLFLGRRGALVAINVKTGEIQTLLSNPNYDLNLFAGAINEDDWNRLLSDPDHPLYDRACQSTYPPGSTYKMIAAIAALNEGIVTPGWSVHCPGYLMLGRKIIHCWKTEGHGTLSMKQAIKNSCNVYFYKLGMKIGIDHWNKYSKLFGFGKKTEIELPNEKDGLVPSEKFYKETYGGTKTNPGLLANLAIGQGELLVTPIQMAQFAMILANEGNYYQPHVVKYLEDKISGKRDSVLSNKKAVRGIQSSVFNLIRTGMREVVDGGTGASSRIYGVTSAGKTGTAQNPHGDSHSWFICFAPYENPEIAMAVIVENGGAGSAVAAPIAGQFLRKYFYYKGEFDYEKEREILRAIWEQQRKEKEQAEQQEESLQQD